MDLRQLKEWAWEQYDRTARSPVHRAAWRIHSATSGMDEGEMASAKTAARPTRKVTVVIAASDMDATTFARHFTHRHRDSLAGQETLPDDITFEVEQMYRAFHMRLHGLRRYKHEHEPDAPEVATDRAIFCLIENHYWGWHELAGIQGHVAVFPEGKKRIATRIDGVVVHHKEVEEATNRLLGIIEE